MFMRNRMIALGTLAIAILPIAATAQNQYFGPEFGVFIPSDSNLRQALGSNWYSIGISTMKESQVLQRRMGTNLNMITQAKNGNKVFLGSYTLGIVQPLGEYTPRADSQPYFAIRAGISYTDYAIGVGLGRVGAKRIGYNANVELGILIGDRLSLAARYDVSPNYDGFNFDGLSITLKYGIAKF